jgi:peptide deformylase
MVEIVTIPNKALRKISKEVSLEEINTPSFKKILEDLSTALKTRDDGVGLSAPQIAINSRVFVVLGRIINKEYSQDLYFINPKIIKFSKKLSTAEEGCLSIPNTYGMVKRPSSVVIEYVDETGEKKTMKATSLLARIFQHEIDHLDGILFTDKAISIKTEKDDRNNQEL